MVQFVHWLFTFSSPYHLIWFSISMVWLVVALILRRKIWPLRGGMIFHALAVFDALFTLGMFGESQVYSVHCVWFNTLMAGLYYWLLKRISAKNDH